MDVERQRVAVVIVKVALILSVVIYGAIALLVVPRMSGTPLPQERSMIFGAILGVVSIAVLAVSWLAVRILPAFARGPAWRLKLEQAGPGGGPGVAALLAFTIYIVRLALAESVAIYGLVLTFQSHDPRWFAAFGGVSVAALALTRYPLDEATEALRNVAPESFQHAGRR